MAYLTFGDVKGFAMDMLSEDETQTVFTQRLLPRWATRTRDRINEWKAWQWKQDEIKLQWAGVANRDISSILYLPEDVGQIQSMYPELDSNYREPVQILSRWEFDQTRPGNTIARGKDYLVLWGYYRVMRDNPSDAPISISASGGAGAENLEVQVRGRNTDNDQISEKVTLDATGSGVTVASFKGGVGGVTDCVILPKSAALAPGAPGIVTFSNGGVELEKLNVAAEQWSRERRRTELYAQIGGGGIYSVAFYRRFPPLVSDSDTYLPEIPNEFSDCIEYGIMSQISLFRQQLDVRNTYEMEWRQRMRELAAWSNRQPGYRPALRVNRQWGSRVGMNR